jgi:hypothetical protein
VTVEEPPTIDNVQPPEAPPDVELTITGRGFGAHAGADSKAWVTFSDEDTAAVFEVPLEVRSWEPTKIVAIAPGLRLLKTTGSLAVNVKFVLEGEEESGSPHLEAFVGSHQELLATDLVYTADGGFDRSGRPTVCFGVRGTLGVDRDVPVGFSEIRLKLDIDAPEATPDQLESLREKTEQYCVVFQTLQNSPRLTVT